MTSMKGAGKYEEDLDEIDFNNYRGIYFEDEPGRKYQDPDTGAHFDFKDMCKRLHPYSEKQRTREEMEARLPQERSINLHLQQQTSEIDRIFNERKRRGLSQGPESPMRRLTFGKENLADHFTQSFHGGSGHKFATLPAEDEVPFSNRSGAIGPAEIQRIQKGLAFSSSGSRNIGPAGPVVTKVKQTEDPAYKRQAQFLSMQGATRKNGGTRNGLAQQSHSLSIDQHQLTSKQARLLSYQQGLPVNDLPPSQRHKTPEVVYKKGPRALADGQSASKLGENSLERKTFDGSVNLTHGSTELKKGETYSSTASTRKNTQIGRTSSGTVGEVSKNFASFYANRRKPMGYPGSSIGKYSLGSGAGVLTQTKLLAKKSSKGAIRTKSGNPVGSLNLHLYGSSGKSRNTHSKHINSLQNYSASHQQHLMSMENRFSNSTLKLEPKSPERSGPRKFVIPAHQLSTASAHYAIHTGHGQSRNGGLHMNGSSGLSGGGSIGAVNLTAGGGASGRKKMGGSYAYEAKKIGGQRRSETKVKSGYRLQ